MTRPLALAALLTLGACAAPDKPRWPVVGDARQGRIWTERMGCGSCHIIPGMENATGLVGPPLDHFSRRTMVAGYLPNTPANLIRWIKEPQAVAPGNAMPSAGLSEEQARDIAAYLYTLG